MSAASLSLAELRKRAIDPARLCGVSAVTYDDGERRGAQALIARNAVGLSATFSVDRALDAAELSYRGVPLTWPGPGNATPVRALERIACGIERTFFGGLVTTCGLDAFGPPGHDRWGSWPQHGHANRLGARDVHHVVRWDDPEPRIEICGTIVQFRMFGAALRLERTWTIALYENRMTLEDRVTNDGGRPAPHMLLYHCNIGYPLLDRETVWSVTGTTVTPRDPVAAAGLAEWNRGGPPQRNFAEQVFSHQPSADRHGWATATASNPMHDGGTALSIAFRPEQLPALFTWRMLGYGTYVMAAEPANCPVIEGRIAAQQRGLLPMLEPEETRSYMLRFGVESPATASSFAAASKANSL